MFCLCLSLQVAHLPAAPHRGPDHLPAGLSGAGQAVSLAAHHVSLMAYIFVYNEKGAICSILWFFVRVIFITCTTGRKKQGQDMRKKGRLGD